MAVLQWAEWALDETASWTTTAPDEHKLDRGREVMLAPMDGPKDEQAGWRDITAGLLETA